MAIVTFNTQPSKGISGELQLDKDNLVALSSVTANTYFADKTNWKRVILYYKSSVRNQNHIVSFNAGAATPTANFFASTKAEDVFEIQHLIIQDFDNGFFKVNRAELVTTEFDITLAAIPVSYGTKSVDFSESTSKTPIDYFVTVSDFTVGVWIKQARAINVGQDNFILTTGANGIVFSMGGAFTTETGQAILHNKSWTRYTGITPTQIDDGLWHHVVYTQQIGLGGYFYVDNTLIKTLSVFEISATSISGLGFGTTVGNSNGSTARFAQADAFSDYMPPALIEEYYNTGKILDPTTHTLSANLVSSFEFGDALGDDATQVREVVSDAIVAYDTIYGIPTIEIDSP